MQLRLRCKKIIKEEYQRYTSSGYRPVIWVTAELEVVEGEALREGTKFTISTMTEKSGEYFELGTEYKLNLEKIN